VHFVAVDKPATGSGIVLVPPTKIAILCPQTMTVATEPMLDDLATIYKALGDPVRLNILKLLPVKPTVCEALYNVGELSEELGIPQPTVSHHLKILRQAGVICFTKKCNSVYYYIDVKALKRGAAELISDVVLK